MGSDGRMTPHNTHVLHYPDTSQAYCVTDAELLGDPGSEDEADEEARWHRYDTGRRRAA